MPRNVWLILQPRQEHQSYDGRMHGGLISVLLDEIMGHYLLRTQKENLPLRQKWNCVTGSPL